MTMSDETAELTGLQDRLLAGVLASVPFDGWSDGAIAAGAQAAGLDEGDAQRCFPGGVRDAMAHFSDWADRAMVAEIHAAGASFQSLKIRQKIAFAVRARLMIVEPHKDAVRVMTAKLALPNYAALAARLVWKTADAMWIEAGDTATDFNHYTKRGLLSGVQASTVLYWLGDSSEGHERSWGFLDRRIENVLVVGKRLGNFKGFGSRLPDAASVLKWPPFARRHKQGAGDEAGGDSGPTVH